MRNLEVKLQVEQHPTAGLLGEPVRLQQVDVYYKVPSGRLKIREITQEGRKTTEGIYYHRACNSEEKISTYELCSIPDLGAFLRTFDVLLRKELTVSKSRGVYFLENARIHLDTGAGL
jgi:adenylate cyclase class IV